jgi:hypothetical protein
MTISLALFILLFFLQIADARTTWMILALGGREENPMLAWLMRKIGIVPALALLKTVCTIPLAVIVRYAGDSSAVQLVLVAAVLLYLWVVAHNKAVLSKMSG